MIKRRVIEENIEMDNEQFISQYNRMMKESRDKGWIICIDKIIQFGIVQGTALEIGPGPGFIGLEWLKKTKETHLHGLDISQYMIQAASENANEYGFLNTRVEYILGNANRIPFEDNYFNAVFTNSTLHEWDNPVQIFNEINRVLKPSGRFYISDFRRDIDFFTKTFLKITTPKSVRQGLIASMNAAYTIPEIEEIIRQSDLKRYSIEHDHFSLIIKGRKQR